MFLEKRNHERFNGKFKIGYKTFNDNGNIVKNVPVSERNFDISLSGIAFDLGYIEEQWLEKNAEIIFQCDSGEIKTIKSSFVRHVLGKETWKAFTFEDASNIELVKSIIEQLKK